ncbi:MAG: type II toxin-antitoxin system YafQ family toxin [Nitrospirae bacterium]|nr:type II toxin-antitoxin system YafQ family toxin [Nitrospirota bacterium]
MSRKVQYPKSFSKKALKLVEKNPALKEPLRKAFNTLEKNAFDPSLKTHTLSGCLKGRYSCHLSHEIRVNFSLTVDTIYLLDIGTHDEAYEDTLE